MYVEVEEHTTAHTLLIAIFLFFLSLHTDFDSNSNLTAGARHLKIQFSLNCWLVKISKEKGKS